MALQPYVHVETLEEYSERFKDFAHMERTEDGILFLPPSLEGRGLCLELPDSDDLRRTLDRHWA